MKKFALLSVVVISSFVSLLSQAVKEPEISVGLFKTANEGIASHDSATSFHIYFKVDGFHWSEPTYFTKLLGIITDLSAPIDNNSDSYVTTTVEVKLSLNNLPSRYREGVHTDRWTDETACHEFVTITGLEVSDDLIAKLW